MRPARVFRLGLLLAAAVGLGAGGCAYDPKFESGKTKCAPATVTMRCPSGFTCNESSGFCVSTGNGAGAGGGGLGGLGGDGAGGGSADGGAKGGAGGTTVVGAGGTIVAGTGGHGGGAGGATGVGGTSGVGGTTGTGGRGGAGGTIGVGGKTGTGGAAGGPASGTITYFTNLPAMGNPYRITSGPDGNLWFVEAAASRIARMTLAGVIDEFPTKTPMSGPFDIVTGLPGFLNYVWFMETSPGSGGTTAVGRVSVGATPALEEFPSQAKTGPIALAVGADNNLWYVDYGANLVGVYNPNDASKNMTFLANGPNDIAAGPDGNLWFTEFATNDVARIVPGTGTITRYPIATTSAFPTDIASDHQTNLWFLEISKVVRVTAQTGAMMEFTVSTTNTNGADILVAPDDGTIWFSNGGNRITKVVASATAITQTPYMVSNPNTAAVTGLTLGPDGNIWFTDRALQRIGRLVR